ncbi:hypothetical protein F4W67_29165 [Pseudomonas caricapapayae]|nr:hypothetical protein F4W67_29165 [Pseudomonas caricapapayae]
MFSPESGLLTLYEVEAWVTESSTVGSILHQLHQVCFALAFARLSRLRFLDSDAMGRPVRMRSRLRFRAIVTDFEIPQFSAVGCQVQFGRTSGVSIHTSVSSNVIGGL